MKNFISLAKLNQNNLKKNEDTTVSDKNTKSFDSRFKRFDYEIESSENDFEEINTFMKLCKNFDSEKYESLDFWKTNCSALPYLSKLAMKVLGVPATCSEAERMFSIAGHIFSIKRRRMTDELLTSLAYCKLNEHHL